MAKSKVIVVEYDHDEIKQAIRSINAAGYKEKNFVGKIGNTPPQKSRSKKKVSIRRRTRI